MKLAKSTLFLLILLFSFSNFNTPKNNIRIIKKNNNTYLYLPQSINFSLNKTTIDNNCKQQLHLIIQNLKQNPTLKIEIGVHNDLRTKEDLSQVRADILKAFFENYGANPNNINAVGYNVSNLLYNCDDEKVKCSEIEQRANRRVEIKILNPNSLEDFIIVNKNSLAVN